MLISVTQMVLSEFVRSVALLFQQVSRIRWRRSWRLLANRRIESLSNPARKGMSPDDARPYGCNFAEA
jgi:hypothetical protein